jgi:hypothetical protein
MAHNAGNRGLSVLAAAAGFAGVAELAGASPLGVSLAIATAAGCFATFDALLSVTLLRLQGTAYRAAVRHVLVIDALTVPIALYGAAAGLLAGGLGWWATALAGAGGVHPEFVLTRARWRGEVVRDVVCGLEVVVVLVALAV